MIMLPGSTDNIGNSYIVRKFMTTKFPGCCVLMQLADILQERKKKLSLRWLSRDDNVLADAISKEDFTAFDPKNRVEVSLAEFPLMTELLETGEQLYDGLREMKTNKSSMSIEEKPAMDRKRTSKTKWG